MNFNKIIIYTDVDGTMATNYNYIGKISKENLDACQTFINEGGFLGVASGRNHESVEALFENIHLNMPFIEANGAAIYDKSLGEYISIKYLSNSFKKKIYNFVKNNEKLTLTAMDNKSKRVKFNDDRDSMIIDYERPFIDYDKYMNNNLLKCAILAKKEDIDDVFEDIVNIVDHETTYSRSAHIYVEFYNAESSKGEGIKIAIQNKDKEHSRKLVCIGDFYNDISMLKIADIAICPKNAVNEVKELCEYIAAENTQNMFVDVLNYLRSKQDE